MPTVHASIIYDDLTRLVRTAFLETLVTHPHLSCYNYHWETDLQTMPAIPDMTIVREFQAHRHHTILGLYHHLPILIEYGWPSVAVYITDANATNANATNAFLRTHLPPRTLADHTSPEVWVTFWSGSEERPRHYRRRIAVHPWSTINDNYPPPTQYTLTQLLTTFNPASAGQLILWHGPPGTGKTHALRALAWAWRHWCQIDYIIDPDVLLGTRSGYLLSTLLYDEGDDDEPTPYNPMAPLHDTPDPTMSTTDPWRLLVLEDTGELLAMDAKQSHGQALSRLLNLTDGLLGQGLNRLVLLTTNEPLGTLHPAIIRPGRCAADIAFPLLSPTDSHTWCATQHLPRPLWPTHATSLADLYAILHTGHPPTPTPTPVGFSGQSG